MKDAHMILFCCLSIGAIASYVLAVDHFLRDSVKVEAWIQRANAEEDLHDAERKKLMDAKRQKRYETDERDDRIEAQKRMYRQ